MMKMFEFWTDFPFTMDGLKLFRNVLSVMYQHLHHYIQYYIYAVYLQYSTSWINPFITHICGNVVMKGLCSSWRAHCPHFIIYRCKMIKYQHTVCQCQSRWVNKIVASSFGALIKVNSACARKSMRTRINFIMKIFLFPLHPLFLFIHSPSCSQTAIRESTHSPVFWYISTVLKYPHWSWKIRLPNCHISLVCCSCSLWQSCFLLELGRKKD